MGLGVLEEKRDSDEEDNQEQGEEDFDTDEDGNVFDKLLRRTRDPGRNALVGSLDPQGRGMVRLVESTDETGDTSESTSDEDERNQARQKRAVTKNVQLTKQMENLPKESKTQDNG